MTSLNKVVKQRFFRTKLSQTDFFEQNCQKLNISNKIVTISFIFFCERSKVIKNENVGDVIKKISAAKKINTLKDPFILVRGAQ